jgi:hypothetical protein
MVRAYPDFSTFVPLFRQCVDDCDTQYLAIRKARKALFDWDNTSNITDISPEAWRCDEMVNWDVNEASMEVPEKPRGGTGAHANPNGPGGAGFGAFLQNMFGPGGAPVVVGTGPMPPMPPGGIGMTFGPMPIIPIPPPPPPPNTGNPGPPPQMNMNNINNTINQAMNALQGMFGPPPPGLFAGPPNGPAAPPPAPVAPLNVPHAPLTNLSTTQAQASTSATAQSSNAGGGLNNGQWFDDSGWTSNSDSEEDDSDEDDEDEGEYGSVDDFDEEENGENDSDDSDEELPDLVLGV